MTVKLARIGSRLGKEAQTKEVACVRRGNFTRFRGDLSGPLNKTITIFTPPIGANLEGGSSSSRPPDPPPTYTDIPKVLSSNHITMGSCDEDGANNGEYTMEEGRGR